MLSAVRRRLLATPTPLGARTRPPRRLSPVAKVVGSVALAAVASFVAPAPRASASEALARTATTDAVHARAAEVFARAERDDAALAFASALAGYEDAVALDPAATIAARADERSRALRARSEGGFGPLVTLERARRGASATADGPAIDALVEAAETFPEGLVRVEAWQLAAQAYAERLGRMPDARRLWQRIATDPHADAVLAGAARRRLVEDDIERGDLSRATTDARLGRDPQLESLVDRARRRGIAHRAALVGVGLTTFLALVACARAVIGGRRAVLVARTRASAPLVVAYGAYVALAGAALASGYEQGTARPFLLFGLVLVPLLFLARAWAAAGSSSRLARSGRAAACAASVLAAAFLVVEQVDATYLAGVGL